MIQIHIQKGNSFQKSIELIAMKQNTKPGNKKVETLGKKKTYIYQTLENCQPNSLTLVQPKNTLLNKLKIT